MVQKKENLDSKIGLFTAFFSNEDNVSVVPLVEFFKEGYIANKIPNEIHQDIRWACNSPQQ
jgi:hypothetical protein